MTDRFFDLMFSKDVKNVELAYELFKGMPVDDMKKTISMLFTLMKEYVDGIPENIVLTNNSIFILNRVSKLFATVKVMCFTGNGFSILDTYLFRIGSSTGDIHFYRPCFENGNPVYKKDKMEPVDFDFLLEDMIKLMKKHD